ncbi:hypothetical protein AX16_001631 [Volvariella volvacea WC 439]|nr:hypothetical protein AX16_001631 [Volvariella volvacea WC 439]
MKSELLPSQSPSPPKSPPPKAKRQNWWRFGKYISVVLAVLVLGYRGYRARLFKHGCGSSVSTHKEDVCPQPSPAAKPSNYSSFYDSPEFAIRSAKRLSGAIQIPTMSYDGMGLVGEDERWEPFGKFHAYLKKTFPVIYDTLDVEVVGGYSPIFTWTGSKPDLKPLMLTAHIDVVPAVTSLDRWTHPPFSGAIDGEWIYGRGAADTKNTLVAILSAVEHLIVGGWKPTRTIIIAFGQDEEISGPQGASNIAKHLESIYPKHGIAMIVDEGGMGLSNLYGTDFALPGVAEKGFINLQIRVDTEGGHSSVPPPHTSIGILAKITSAIEDSPIFQPHLELTSPIWGFLNCLAHYGDNNQIPDWLRRSVNAKNPDLSTAATEFAKTAPKNRYLIQTSKTPTIVHGGIKSNALAESVTVTFNTRIDLFSSTKEILDVYLDLIRPIAGKYYFRLNNEALSDGAPIGNITLSYTEPLEPSPISPTDAGAWILFSKAVQATFGENVITAPSAMTGNTDTRYYWNLSRNIYRFSPVRSGAGVNIHTVDEKIKLILQVDGVDDNVL